MDRCYSVHLELLTCYVLKMKQFESAVTTKVYDVARWSGFYPIRGRYNDADDLNLDVPLPLSLDVDRSSSAELQLSLLTVSTTTDRGFVDTATVPSMMPPLMSTRVHERTHRSLPAEYLGPNALYAFGLDSLRGADSSRTGSGESASEAAATARDIQQTLTSMQQMIADQAKRIEFLEGRMASVVRFEDCQVRQCNGMYVWRIREVAKKRATACAGKTSALHSPGFYTSPYGYRMCVRVNLNGLDAGVGRHLALFIHFERGENDDILDWPFNGVISLSIVDQSDACADRRHITESLVAKPDVTAFQRPTLERNKKGFGYIEFTSLSVLDDPRYVRDDTLIIRASVKVPDSK